MKVTVIGTGYVGLVAGTCFANFGMQVTCLDSNSKIIKSLEAGKVTIHEPGLEELVKKNIAAGRLHFSSDNAHLENSDVLVVAVGTPEGKSGKPNMKYINSVLQNIVKFVKTNKVVLIKSTVPIHTAKKFREYFAKHSPKIKFSVVSNPEFLREGSAVHDFNHPDRIIIGCNDERGKDAAKVLYGSLINKGVPVVYSSNQTAEFIKYCANSYLAMRIGFINEMSDIAEKIGADIDEVAYGIGLDKRIGCHYLKAGPGFGGSCFPKDTKALLTYSSEVKAKSLIVDAVIKSNNARKKLMARKILNALGSKVKGKTVAILGLSFKADTDDIRDSASLIVIPELIKEGVKVQAYDPSNSKELEGKFSKNFHLSFNLSDALKGADAAVIMTEWSEFKLMCLKTAKEVMNEFLIIDLRSLIDHKEALAKGFKYIGIGKTV